MNPQLIEQLKQGTPLEYDIDNLELLRKVLKEAFPKDVLPVKAAWKFYMKHPCDENSWICSDQDQPNAIPLSSFLEPKMVEVEKLEAFIEENMFGVGYIDCVSLFQFIKDNKQ